VNPSVQDKLTELYTIYNETIKLLIAEYEAREEQFPLPIFNEIRAYNDHVAQLYRTGISEEKQKEELSRAERHIKRIVFDCYKYLNVSMHDSLERFEKQTRHVDFTLVRDGEFFPQYKRLRREATQLKLSARKIESANNGEAFTRYEQAYIKYNELEEFISSNIAFINRLKARTNLGRIGKVIFWILSAIISGIIGQASGLTWGKIAELFGTSWTFFSNFF